MKNLGIDRGLHVNASSITKNPIEKAIEMFDSHPSILKINEMGYNSNLFSFKHVSDLNIHDEINNIDSSKAYQKDNIPPILFKENNDICATVICSDINQCIDTGSFPSNLKNADITPLFKKKTDRLLKSNYRPVSILPTLSRIYEKILYQQIYEYFNSIVLKILIRRQKGS